MVAGAALAAFGGFFAGGGGSTATGLAKGMRCALSAFCEAKVSAGWVGLICQFDSCMSWRSFSGSAAYIARMRRGSLSSVPTHIWMNTSLVAQATASVGTPPTAPDGPM